MYEKHWLFRTLCVWEALVVWLQATCTLTHVVTQAWCFTAHDAVSRRQTAATLLSMSRLMLATGSTLVSCASETTRHSSHSLTTHASTTHDHLLEPATLLAYKLVCRELTISISLYVFTTEQLQHVCNDVDLNVRNYEHTTSESQRPFSQVGQER